MQRKFWTDVWFLLVFAACGLLFTFGAMMALQAAMGTTTLMLHLAQWTQNVALMLLPALAWVRIYKKERIAADMYLWWPGWRMMLLTLALMLVSLPLMDALSMWCERLPLPQALYDVAMATKAEQDVMIGMLLDVDGVAGWMMLIALMCVMTAVGEEALFRGALLRCFVSPDEWLHCRQWKKIIGVALTVGLLFSVCHGDVFGLIPRTVLGALFVVLVWRTRSIYPAILAHATNNLFALIEMKAAPRWLDWPSGAAWMVSISGLLAALVLWLLLRRDDGERD